MFERLKHAVLALAGRCPAEVRDEEGDRKLAHRMSREWAETYFDGPFSPGTGASVAEVEEVIFNAICEFTDAQIERRREEEARRRGKRQTQMEIPF